ncbi:MAG: DNA cytosine methyltransferase [Candidatus Berkelbacteria bacterium]|nr:DNA cytosine methyltransferase [Candidatus Berkelbacteria bacterium]
MQPLNIIDLFCGAGGLSYGFGKNNFFNILAANEILSDAANAYFLNHPTARVYVGDIKDLEIPFMLKDLQTDKKNIDIVIGGPPCQAYSTVGKRLMDDPRATLFHEYFRIIKNLEPKFFIFENVKGLLSMQNGKLINTIIDLFKSLNYRVDFKVLNVADYGVPQIRERVIITGSKFNKRFQYPKPTHSSDNSTKYLTVENALSDLAFIKSNESSNRYAKSPQNEYQKMMREERDELLTEHSSPKNNKKLVKIMELLPDGGTPSDIPEQYRPTSGFKNTYCRLWWQRPCTTITRNLGTPSSSRCIHPVAPRPLTTREGARIQSFPDSYQFYGSKSSKNLQIGEAVPPLLSISLADAVKKHFEENKNQWISINRKKDKKLYHKLGLKKLSSNQLDLEFEG